MPARDDDQSAQRDVERLVDRRAVLTRTAALAGVVVGTALCPSVPASAAAGAAPAAGTGTRWPTYQPDPGATMIVDRVCQVKNDPDREERRSIT